MFSRIIKGEVVLKAMVKQMYTANPNKAYRENLIILINLAALLSAGSISPDKYCFAYFLKYSSTNSLSSYERFLNI